MNYYERIIELIVEGSAGERRNKRQRASKNPKAREKGWKNHARAADRRALRSGKVTPEDVRASHQDPDSKKRTELAHKIGYASGEQIIKGMNSPRYTTTAQRKIKKSQS